MMERIAVEVEWIESPEAGNMDPIKEIRNLEIKDGYIVIPEDVRNITDLKEKNKTLLSSVKGITFPTNVELNIKHLGFWIDHKAFRKCQDLYKDGFLIINNMLVDYIGSDKNIIIPDGVEIINDRCFESRMDFDIDPIELISFPPSMRIIGDMALYSFNYSKQAYERTGFIKDISFRGGSKNLEYVGNYSIPECSELIGLDCYDSLLYFGDNFWRCDPSFFDICSDYWLYGPILFRYEKNAGRNIADDVETLVIPNGVEFIAGDGMFCNMKNLREIKLPGSLKSIGRGAFKWDKGLTHIDFPESLKYIGEFAFLWCSSLSNIVIPENVERIGRNAFKMKDDTGISVSVPGKLSDIYGGREQCLSFIGLPNAEGLLIQGNTLCDAYNIERDSVLTIPEGVKIVHIDVIERIDEVIQRYGEKREIIFPSTVEYIQPYTPYLNKKLSYVLPEKYLKQKRKLNEYAVKHYLETENTDSLGIETFVTLFLYQNKKAIDQFCIPRMLKDADTSMQLICENLSEDNTPKSFQHVAQFIIDNKDDIPSRRIKEFFELCEHKGMKKSITLLKPVFDNLDYNDIDNSTDKESKEQQFSIWGKTFVTTRLSDSDEKYVRSSVEAKGGVFKPHFVNSCNYLVCYTRDGLQTTKYEKALVQMKKGSDIKIITLEEFKIILSNATDEKPDSISISSKSNQVPKYVFPENEEDILDNAVKLFKKYVKQFKEKMDGARATVIETPHKAGGAGRKITEAFYGRLYDLLSSEEGRYLNDGAYSPEELYRSWMHDFGAGEGQVGLCLTLGLFLAEYALCENNASGDLVYARDKWEYRGDYSSRTRPALHIEPNMNEWKVYSKKGYDYYDM